MARRLGLLQAAHPTHLAPPAAPATVDGADTESLACLP
jgi:hypothetical protein